MAILIVILVIMPATMATFAASDNDSETKGGYYIYVEVDGAVNGIYVTDFYYRSTATCSSGNNQCGSSGNALTIYWGVEYYMDGSWYCGASHCNEWLYNSGSPWAGLAPYADGPDLTARFVLNTGASGWIDLSTKTVTQVTDTLDAGLPAN
jgi:hypothetical protein